MSIDKKQKIGFILISISAVLVLIGIISQEPIPQDTSYHLFADSRMIWLIPNFWNTVTNLPFIIVGIYGLIQFRFSEKFKFNQEKNIAYAILFFATVLVGLGSGYYHLSPDNQTLVWDRLPMTVAFMALFSIIISEFISKNAGKKLLLPLIIAGILSVLYWHISESNGSGDLRFYALVQFYPILAIPIILLFFPSQCSHTRAYWLLLLSYVVAKVFEHFDVEIYQMTSLISGHSLKHIIAALGLYVLLLYYLKRKCYVNRF